MNIRYNQGGRRNMMLSFTVCAMFVSVLFARPAGAVSYAGVSVRVETPQQTVFHDTVYISDMGCTVKDSAGVAHVLTSFSALCALDAAAVQGNFTYQTTSFLNTALFVNSIAGVVGDAKNYWLYYVNEQLPAVGIQGYTVKDGDEVLLSYGSGTPPLRIQMDKANPRVSDTVSFVVDASQYDAVSQSSVFAPVKGVSLIVSDGTNALTVTTDAAGHASFTPSAPGAYTVRAEGYGYTRSISVPLRAYKRYARMSALGRSLSSRFIDRSGRHLRSSVQDDGTIDQSIAVSEWSAMGLAATGLVPGRLEDAVRNYNPTETNGASELSRHILALEALRENAHNFRDVNYVQRLFNTMNAAQFGDASLCNDDIFAVLALLSAGMSPETEGLQQGLSQSLKCVSATGGVSFAVGGSADVDTTAAWLMMIGRYSDVAVRLTDAQYAAQQSALDYLRAAQNPDGGWGYAVGQPSNSSSTAWVLLALRAQHHEAKSMTTNFRNGFHFLRNAWDRESGVEHYDADGTSSLESLNTAYALMAFERRPLPVNLSAELEPRLLPAQKASVFNR